MKSRSFVLLIAVLLAGSTQAQGPILKRLRAALQCRKACVVHQPSCVPVCRPVVTADVCSAPMYADVCSAPMNVSVSTNCCGSPTVPFLSKGPEGCGRDLPTPPPKDCNPSYREFLACCDRKHEGNPKAIAACKAAAEKYLAHCKEASRRGRANSKKLTGCDEVCNDLWAGCGENDWDCYYRNYQACIDCQFCQGYCTPCPESDPYCEANCGCQ